jgi:hypothetical protein
MPYIEKNHAELQVVIHHLKKSGDGLEFILFPMVHLGTQEFYDEVSHRLSECDLILAEGVHSKRVSFLTLPYRIAAKSRRINLLVQQQALNVSSFKDKIFKSDLDARSFDERWSNINLRLRIELLFTVPIVALHLFFFVGREKLANYILRKDTASKNEVRDEEMEQYARLMGGDRNQALIQNIKQLYEARRKEKIKIAIPYGAKHMSRIMKFLLNKLGYRVIKRERVTIFDF